MSRKQAHAMAGVLQEIRRERYRQHAKWGEQNHPDFDQVLLGREGGCTPERMAEQYEVPTESRAKFLCENAFHFKGGTFAHILVEEVAEAIAACHDPAELRAELVQVAAVAASWIEAIDRRSSP